MDPRGLLPVPDVIPAPWWVFEGLGQLTFFVHIVLVNVVLGGVLLLLGRRLLGSSRSGRAASGLATSGLATSGLATSGQVPGTLDALRRPLPTTLALAINMGVAPLLFLQVIYGHLFYTSSVLMAVPWILVIPSLILGYYALYVYTRREAGASGSPGAGPLATGALAIAALFFLLISFVYVNNLTLMQRPDLWGQWFAEKGGTILNVADPTFLPRWLHYLTASVAVAGLAASILHAVRDRRARDETASRAASPVVSGGQAVGLRIFAHATAVQIVGGLWWFLALPRGVRLAFMGGDVLATALFGLGFLAAIGVLVTAFLGKLRPTVIQLAVVMVLMVATRAVLRHAYLDETFSPDSLSLAPQYDVLALFLAVLVVGLACVAWMVRAATRTRAPAAEPSAGGGPSRGEWARNGGRS